MADINEPQRFSDVVVWEVDGGEYGVCRSVDDMNADHGEIEIGTLLEDGSSTAYGPWLTSADTTNIVGIALEQIDELVDGDDGDNKVLNLTTNGAKLVVVKFDGLKPSGVSADKADIVAKLLTLGIVAI